MVQKRKWSESSKAIFKGKKVKFGSGFSASFVSENIKLLRKYKHLMKDICWANIEDWFVHLLDTYNL